MVDEGIRGGKMVDEGIRMYVNYTGTPHPHIQYV